MNILNYNIKKVINFKNIYEYFLVLMTILMSGAIVITPFLSEAKYIYIMSFLFTTFLIINNKRFTFNKFSIFTLFLLTILTSSHLLSNDMKVKLLILQYSLLFFISLFISTLIKVDDFKNIYVNILFCIAITSLFFYFLFFINPNFVFNLPTITVFRDYGNAYYLHAYMPGIYYRNNSIFWEPGAYQAFVNIALFFEISKEEKKSIFRIIIFIITIVTTFSTTGFLILFMLISFWFIQIKSKTKYFYILPFIVFLVLSVSFKETVIDKFKNNNRSGVRRKLDAKVCLKIFSEAPLLGKGVVSTSVQFNKIISKYPLHGLNDNSSNGFVLILARFGIIYWIFINILYFLFAMNISKNKIGVIILYLTILFTLVGENFSTKPLWIIMLFYGTNYLKFENTISEKINNIKNTNLVKNIFLSNNK